MASSNSSLETHFNAGEENYRMRKRNRCKLSCLSCYASKRKCDRQRPCTRCVRMGLTGLCIYEIEDPFARDRGQLDENIRLQRRVAELESVVREMKNQPHPRWTIPGGMDHNPEFTRPPRRGPSRRAKPEADPSSIDAFFAFSAETKGEEAQLKTEENSLVPEFTPSKPESKPESASPSGPSMSRFDSPRTALSAHSQDSTPPISLHFSDHPSGVTASTPFAFHNDATEPLSPLSSFVQRSRHNSKLQRKSCSPAPSESSEEGPPLAILFPPVNSTNRSFQLTSQESSAHTASIEMQASPISSAAPTGFSPSFHAESEHDDRDCRCLVNPSVYNSLVFFASALRTSREALEALHPSVSNCVLFRRIVELDHYIFSAPPPSLRNSTVHGHDDFISGNSTTAHPPQEPTFALSSPSPHLHSPSFPSFSQAYQQDWGCMHDVPQQDNQLDWRNPHQ